MKFVVDYHFHPNLPKNKARAISKCKKWWKAFKKNGVNTVIVTEHNYKDAEKAYQLMKQTKPKDCFVFPGIEYETKEWIDMIIFSDKEDIYSYKEIKNSRVTYDQMMAFIKKKKFQVFIPHPYIIGLTSIIDIKGHDFYKKAADEAGAVEITNTSLDNLKKFLLKFNLMKKKIKRISKVQDLPRSDYPKKIKFLAAGSDAHFYEEVGTGMLIDATEKTLFNAIISNKSPKIIRKNKPFSTWLLFRTGLNVFDEFLIKRAK